MFSIKSSTKSQQRQLMNLFAQVNMRGFATISTECQDHLKKLGIKNPNIVFNPT